MKNEIKNLHNADPRADPKKLAIKMLDETPRRPSEYEMKQSEAFATTFLQNDSISARLLMQMNIPIRYRSNDIKGHEVPLVQDWMKIHSTVR